MSEPADNAAFKLPDLRDLVGHAECVQIADRVGLVYERFEQHGYAYMAVLDGERCTGLCSRDQIGMVLGSQYGRALNLKRTIGEYLLPEPMTVTVGTPLPDVLQRAFSRPLTSFYEDVVLQDENGAFLGLIYAHTLVKLQNRLLEENIRELRHRRDEIAARNREMETDLHMARELQLAMLPRRYPQFAVRNDPVSSRALRFRHRYEPAGTMGGDFFKILRISNASAGVFVCDVMGHGVRAALITSMLSAVLQELRPMADRPGPLLTRLNGHLCDMLEDSGDVMFATALYVAADLEERRVSFAKAGHPDAVIRRRKPLGVAPLECHNGASGPALGLFPQARYETTKQPFGVGDSVILFTDGLYEVPNDQEEDFGEKRLQQIMHRYRDLPVEQLFDRTIRDVRRFAADRSFLDDICLVALEMVEERNPDGE